MSGEFPTPEPTFKAPLSKGALAPVLNPRFEDALGIGPTLPPNLTLVPNIGSEPSESSIASPAEVPEVTPTIAPNRATRRAKARKPHGILDQAPLTKEGLNKIVADRFQPQDTNIGLNRLPLIDQTEVSAQPKLYVVGGKNDPKAGNTDAINSQQNKEAGWLKSHLGVKLAAVGLTVQALMTACGGGGGPVAAGNGENPNPPVAVSGRPFTVEPTSTTLAPTTTKVPETTTTIPLTDAQTVLKTAGFPEATYKKLTEANSSHQFTLDDGSKVNILLFTDKIDINETVMKAMGNFITSLNGTEIEVPQPNGASPVKVKLNLPANHDRTFIFTQGLSSADIPPYMTTLGFSKDVNFGGTQKGISTINIAKLDPDTLSQTTGIEWVQGLLEGVTLNDLKSRESIAISIGQAMQYARTYGPYIYANNKVNGVEGKYVLGGGTIIDLLPPATIAALNLPQMGRPVILTSS